MSYIQMYRGVKTFNFQWGVTNRGGGCSRFVFELALEFCQGRGVDVGSGRLQWKLPGSIPIDPAINRYDALNIPYQNLDYVFSSHTLQHLDNYVQVVEYWFTILKSRGVVFLYLPHKSMPAWDMINNPQHKHNFQPRDIQDLLIQCGFIDVICSGVDLNNSFSVVGCKP